MAQHKEARELFGLTHDKYIDLHDALMEHGELLGENPNLDVEESMTRETFIAKCIAHTAVNDKSREEKAKATEMLEQIFDSFKAQAAHDNPGQPAKNHVTVEHVVVGFQTLVLHEGGVGDVVDMLIEMYDFNEEGTIKVDELLEFFENSEVFRNSLRTGEAKLDCSKVREAAEAECKKMLAECDEDDSGEIDEEEFHKYYKRLHEEHDAAEQEAHAAEAAAAAAEAAAAAAAKTETPAADPAKADPAKADPAVADPAVAEPAAAEPAKVDAAAKAQAAQETQAAQVAQGAQAAQGTQAAQAAQVTQAARVSGARVTQAATASKTTQAAQAQATIDAGDAHHKAAVAAANAAIVGSTGGVGAGGASATVVDKTLHATAAAPNSLSFKDACDIFKLTQKKFGAMYETMMNSTQDSGDLIDKSQFVSIVVDTLDLAEHPKVAMVKTALQLVFEEHLLYSPMGLSKVRVVFEGLIIGFQIFFPPSEAAVASDFLFKLYDFNHEGTITRDEVFEFVEHSKISKIALLPDALKKQERESITRDSEAETATFMAEVDTNGDGTITPEEFRNWYQNSVLTVHSVDAAAVAAASGANAEAIARQIAARRLRASNAKRALRVFDNKVRAEAFHDNARKALLKFRRMFSMRTDDLKLLQDNLKEAAGVRGVLTSNSFMTASSSALQPVFNEVVDMAEKGEMRRALFAIYSAFKTKSAGVDLCPFRPLYLGVAELLASRDRMFASKIIFNALCDRSAGDSLGEADMAHYLLTVLSVHNGLVQSDEQISEADISILAEQEAEQLFEYGGEGLTSYKREHFDEWFVTRLAPETYSSIDDATVAMEKVNAMQSKVNERENLVAAREAQLEERMRAMEERERTLRVLEEGGDRSSRRRAHTQLQNSVTLRDGALIPVLPTLRRLIRLNVGDFRTIVSELKRAMRASERRDDLSVDAFVQACMVGGAQRSPTVSKWLEKIYSVFVGHTDGGVGGDGKTSLIEAIAAVALLSHRNDEAITCGVLYGVVGEGTGQGIDMGAFLEIAVPMTILEWNASGRYEREIRSGNKKPIASIVKEVVEGLKAVPLSDGWSPRQPISRSRFGLWFRHVLDEASGGNDAAQKYPPARAPSSAAEKQWSPPDIQMRPHTGRYQMYWTCCQCADHESRTCCTKDSPTHLSNWWTTHTYDDGAMQWRANPMQKVDDGGITAASSFKDQLKYIYEKNGRHEKMWQLDQKLMRYSNSEKPMLAGMRNKYGMPSLPPAPAGQVEWTSSMQAGEMRMQSPMTQSPVAMQQQMQRGGELAMQQHQQMHAGGYAMSGMQTQSPMAMQSQAGGNASRLQTPMAMSRMQMQAGMELSPAGRQHLMQQQSPMVMQSQMGQASSGAMVLAGTSAAGATASRDPSDPWAGSAEASAATAGGGGGRGRGGGEVAAAGGSRGGRGRGGRGRGRGGGDASVTTAGVL